MLSSGFNSKYLEVIPSDVVERDYGCGDPTRWVYEGDRVLDLGSGSGKNAFICAQVVGKKGLVPQRRYISQYFPDGKKIVSMDDDVQNMIQLKRDDSLKKIANLDSLFKRFFKTLIDKDLYLWGCHLQLR